MIFVLSEHLFLSQESFQLVYQHHIRNHHGDPIYIRPTNVWRRSPDHVSLKMPRGREKVLTCAHNANLLSERNYVFIKGIYCTTQHVENSNPFSALQGIRCLGGDPGILSEFENHRLEIKPYNSGFRSFTHFLPRLHWYSRLFTVHMWCKTNLAMTKAYRTLARFCVCICAF